MSAIADHSWSNGNSLMLLLHDKCPAGVEAPTELETPL